MRYTYEGLLAAPVLNPLARHPAVEAFDGLGVDVSELQTIYALRTAAQEALSELRAGRPGGTAWKAAEADDIEATMAGKPTTGLAKLLAGDLSRWSRARIACGAFAIAVATPLAELRRATKAAVAPKIIELEEEFTSTALAGWHVRENRPSAWEHRLQCEAIMSRWQLALGLLRWADGGHYQRAKEQPSGAGGGAYYALVWWLDGKRSWISSGGGLVWPAGSDAELWGYKVSDLSQPPQRPVRPTVPTSPSMRLTRMR